MFSWSLADTLEGRRFTGAGGGEGSQTGIVVVRSCVCACVAFRPSNRPDPPPSSPWTSCPSDSLLPFFCFASVARSQIRKLKKKKYRAVLTCRRKKKDPLLLWQTPKAKVFWKGLKEDLPSLSLLFQGSHGRHRTVSPRKKLLLCK